MLRSRTVGRRKFFRQAAAAASTAGAAGCGRNLSPWRSFTPAEARTIEAVCECIIPGDEEPGARRANVIGYIDRQLCGHFRGVRPLYREGIAAIDRLAGGSFADLPEERQLEVMRRLEMDPASRPFLDNVVAHTMQGFYGSPRHGGNRDFASWRMLGIPVSPNRGRNLDEFRKEGSNEKG